MDPKDSNPGVSTPPVQPAAPAATVPAEPNGGDPVTSTGKTTDEQTVPFTRFQEINDKAKAEADRAAQLESELEALRSQQPQSRNDSEDDVEPDVLDLVRKSANKLGFVSKEELNAREAQIQVRQDITDLTSQYKDSGIPFDGKKVVDYAKTNNIPVTSKKALEAVYRDMNYDAIVEAQRKAAVDAYQQNGKSQAEKPGSEGAKPPAEPQPANLKERVRLARERAGFSTT